MIASRTRWFGVVAVGLLAVVVWLAWPLRRPSVLLITVDSLRPDYLTCYGGQHSPTPSIDALARGGVLFTQAITPVPWTRASMATVLTGLYPTAHQVRLPYDRLPLHVPTVADLFRQAGYKTGAIVSSFYLDRIFQLDQGFSSYDDRFDAPMLIIGKAPPGHVASVYYGDISEDRNFRRRKLRSDSMRGDTQTTDAAIGWLRAAGRRPFFLWVHYFGAHERRGLNISVWDLVAAYQPAVSRVDAEVGRLLEALRSLRREDDTIVVLHGDHGQNLLGRGGFGHGDDLYEPNVRVPLIFRWPLGLPPGRQVEALVSLADVAPSLTELTGVTGAQSDGRSAVPLARGDAPAWSRDIYCETLQSATAAAGTSAGGAGMRFGYVRRAMRGPKWKFIRNEPHVLVDIENPRALPAEVQTLVTEELYDLAEDPREENNLINAQPAIAGRLREQMQAFTAGPRH